MTLQKVLAGESFHGASQKPWWHITRGLTAPPFVSLSLVFPSFLSSNFPNTICTKALSQLLLSRAFQTHTKA